MSLDKRALKIKSDHAALNTLLQGGAAIIFKEWVCTTVDMCNERSWKFGKDYWIMAMIHDEQQCAVKEEIAEEFRDLIIQAATKAGEKLGMKCRVDAEAKIGNNWADCH